jgi:hypothetical protein
MGADLLHQVLPVDVDTTLGWSPSQAARHIGESEQLRLKYVPKYVQ